MCDPPGEIFQDIDIRRESSELYTTFEVPPKRCCMEEMPLRADAADVFIYLTLRESSRMPPKFLLVPGRIRKFLFLSVVFLSFDRSTSSYLGEWFGLTLEDYRCRFACPHESHLEQTRDVRIEGLGNPHGPLLFAPVSSYSLDFEPVESRPKLSREPDSR